MSYSIQVNEGGLTELIQNLAKDCSNTQWLREFTKNSFEAIESYRKEVDSDFKGEVIVDYDPLLAENGLFKIQIIDNGIGMSEEELKNFPRQLSSTSSIKKKLGNNNYGVGAKISSLTRNHAGIVYQSWKDGIGKMICIHFHDGGYTYKNLGVEGEVEYISNVDDAVKHKIIKDHGTIVTLLGMEETSDTMNPVSHGLKKGSREAWIQEYLNKRYFQIPDYISLKSRDGYFKEGTFNSLRNIFGMTQMLEKNSILKGVVELEDADVNWYVLDENRPDGKGREFKLGHTAVVHEDEIFEISLGHNKQPRFGIGWKNRDVVLHVHPKGDNYHQNISRNSLSFKGEETLPWDKWQDQFRDPEIFPEELKKFLQDALENDDSTGSRDLKRKLKDYAKFYSLSSFKKFSLSKSGTVEVDPNDLEEGFSGGFKGGDKNRKKTNPSKGPNSGHVDAYLSIMRKEGSGKKAKELSDPFPKLVWTKDSGGLVSAGELTDRAALFRKEAHTVFANEEYTGFTDTIEFFKKEFPLLHEKIIISAVQDTFGTQLLETIAGAMSLEKRKHWAGEYFEKAISPESLTVAVGSRMFFYQQIKRELTQKIKQLSVAKEENVV